MTKEEHEQEQLMNQHFSVPSVAWSADPCRDNAGWELEEPMGNVLILGDRSDIGKEVASMFRRDKWRVLGWNRDSKEISQEPWDAVVCCIGTLEPIGQFFDTDHASWEKAIDSNALLPLRLLRAIWGNRRKNASVCFFSGSGTSRPAPTYSAYSASKFLLFKMTELLDDEYQDVKVFILGPGMLKTKIQQQTLAARDRAWNYERVWKFMTEGDELHGPGTPMDKIYQCLRWCMDQPKDVIGGRNIYVPIDKWGDAMALHLKSNPHFFKLRRFGDGFSFP